MPQPTPARNVLLHLLRGMVELQSEPSAISGPPAIRTVVVDDDRHVKKHLEWIYPLVLKAVQVAGKERDDGELLEMLGKVLQEIGN